MKGILTITSIFVAALFTITKPGSNLDVHQHEWIKKIWYIPIKNISFLKRKEILPYATVGMEPEDIMLSKISQS